MSEDLVELRVHGVSVDPTDCMPIVVLLDVAGESGMPVPVGPFEASAIILEIEGVSPPRPLTHDLLADIFRDSGLALESVELYGASEGCGGSPQARLRYRRGLRRVRKEVRPSDAIALALRLGAPILAERSMLGPRSFAESTGGEPEPGPEAWYLRAAAPREARW